MNVHLISVEAIESTPNPSSRAAGLARGADALVERGLPGDLAAAGAPVVQRARPRLHGDQISGDPIDNLGRLNGLIAGDVANALATGAFPVLAGGTCNHLIGMLAGMQQAYGVDARIGLLWLDAHGDFNTPRTTRSGMLGGMPVAVAAGLCHARWRELAGMRVTLPTDRIVMVDVRSLDPDEKTLVTATDVRIARFGSHGDTCQVVTAVQRLADQVDHIYLHVDSDVLDASFQPNHPSVESDGPSLAVVVSVLQKAMATGKARAFGVVSVNPDGPDGETSLASTREMIVEGVRAKSGHTPGV